MPPPYTERRSEQYTDHVTREQVNEKGELERSTSSETVNRTTNRTITPGRDKTTTNEQIRESSRESTNTAANPSIFEPGGNSSDIQNLYRSGTENRFHDQDPFASEEDISLQFRFYVPHPKRRKAQIERAQREIELARIEARGEEREVVLEIRKMYEELQYAKTQISLYGSEDAAAENYESTQQRMLDEGLITIDKVEFVARNPFEVEFAREEFESLRGKLAAKVGLRDENRIRVTDRLISPAVNLGVSDLPYLIEMAFANRAELTSVMGRGRIAEADLKEAKAKLMPWFEYIQAGVGRGEQGGIQTDTSWSVQFAMNLPVFSWFGHEREIYEAAIASYYAQQEASQGIITSEVAAAYKGVQRSASLRSRARGHSVSQKKRNDDFLARFEGMEELQYAETRYDMARVTARTDLQRLKAERSYNRALIDLENAIGAPLDRIFDGGGKAAEIEVTASAAPAKPLAKVVEQKQHLLQPLPSSRQVPQTSKPDADLPTKPRTLLDRLRSTEGKANKRTFGKRRR